jgi:hypothetical protein
MYHTVLKYSTVLEGSPSSTVVCQSKYFFVFPLIVEEDEYEEEENEEGTAVFFFAPFDASIFAEAALDAAPPADR